MDITILGIVHKTKNEDQKAIYRAGGSIGFPATARSILMFSKHPDDEKLTVVEQIKHNLVEKRQAFGYRLHSRERPQRSAPS